MPISGSFCGAQPLSLSDERADNLYQGSAAPSPSTRLGQDAPINAAMRADALLDKGDLDGYAVWRRIVKAVEELLSKERPAGVTVQ